MIGIVDYEAGNISSVANALTAIGPEFVVSADERTLANCSGIILPGVGAAQGAMASLNNHKLTKFLSSVNVPFLGICLGMQLLYELSEEGKIECLGVLKGTVRKFDATMPKIPHMGWNSVEVISNNPLTQGLSGVEYFYFAHSYYSDVDETTIGVIKEKIPFSGIVMKKNYFGVQFHPEKSGSAGLKLLKNFDAICKSSRQ